MVDFTVGQQVLVPDREYPANGSVGGTIQWIFDGPDGVKQCTVVLPVGRVRVYNCTDLLQYNVEDDFYGEVNRCMVPGCHGTKQGKIEFCSPCYTAYRNCGFKKFTVEERKHKFIMMQASRQFTFFCLRRSSKAAVFAAAHQVRSSTPHAGYSTPVNQSSKHPSPGPKRRPPGVTPPNLFRPFSVLFSP